MRVASRSRGRSTYSRRYGRESETSRSSPRHDFGDFESSFSSLHDMQKKVQRLRTLSVRETNYCRLSRRVKYLDNLTDFLKDIDSRDQCALHRNREVLWMRKSVPLIATSSIWRTTKSCVLIPVRCFLRSLLNSVRPTIYECSDQSASWDSSARPLCGHSEYFAEKVKSRESQHLILSTPLKQLKSSNELTIEQSNHLRCHRGFALDEHGNSASLPTTSKPRFSQASGTDMLDNPPDLDHGTAPFDVSFRDGDNKNTVDVPGDASFAPWLIDPSDTPHDWTAQTCDQTLTEYLEWSYDQGTKSRHIPSDTEVRARIALSTTEVWNRCRSAEAVRASTVYDATKNMSACPWQGPRSLESFSPTRTDTRTRPGTTLEKTLTRSLTGSTWSVRRVFLCIVNAVRPVGTILNGHDYAILFFGLFPRIFVWRWTFWCNFDSFGVACCWPSSGSVEWNIVAEFCAKKFPSSPCGSNFACVALGIPADEHSPYDSVPWKRPLRSR